MLRCCLTLHRVTSALRLSVSTSPRDLHCIPVLVGCYACTPGSSFTLLCYNTALLFHTHSFPNALAHLPLYASRHTLDTSPSVIIPPAGKAEGLSHPEPLGASSGTLPVGMVKCRAIARTRDLASFLSHEVSPGHSIKIHTCIGG